MRFKRRSTPAGQHRPVLLDEVLDVLCPAAGEVAVDATAGFGGHSAELLARVGPAGKLLSVDMDGEHLAAVRARLEAVGHPFELIHANFAGLDRLLAERGLQANVLLADLGMSSMQVDDPERGFSYSREGALDMRMDRSRGKTVAALLHTIDEEELAQALHELGDEPEARTIARAIVEGRANGNLLRTADLVALIRRVTGQEGPWRLHPSKGKWNLHPAARTFQALRILVNRELANLSQLLRVLPHCLAPGGRAAIISFHSGEDRLVKKAFQEGLRNGTYAAGSDEAIRPTFNERQTNPRSRSAKMRWVRME